MRTIHKESHFYQPNVRSFFLPSQSGDCTVILPLARVAPPVECESVEFVKYAAEWRGACPLKSIALGKKVSDFVMIGSSLLTLHDPATSEIFYRKGYWRKDTFYSLLVENAAKYPNAKAFSDNERTLSWKEALEEVHGIASLLHSAGLRRGDRVTVWLPNCIETALIVLACSRNGYVSCCSLHINYSPYEVKDLLLRMKARAFFGVGPMIGRTSFAGAFDELSAEELGLLIRVHVPKVGHAPLNTKDVTAYESVRMSKRSPPPPNENADKIISLSFTSGTSGAPKGVLHSDNTLLCNARSLVQDWQHPADTVLLSLSPMTHAIGIIALGQALVGGYQMVMNSPPKGLSTFQWICKCGATYVMGVPTHAIDAVAQMKAFGSTSMGRVRVFYMGGAAIPAGVILALAEAGIKAQSVYGMTENGAHQYTRPDDDLDAISKNAGYPAQGYETKIWKEDNPDIEAANGEVGEIGGRGACLMLGYFSDQSLTEQSFNRHGWFMSGDLGRIDQDGRLEIIGRKKDVIVRGGKNIYPLELEMAAARHPALIKVAVFPVADDRLGERIALAAIPASDQTIEVPSLMEFLRDQKVSKYNLPEYIAILDEFPTTPSGKVVKIELTRKANRGDLNIIRCFKK